MNPTREYTIINIYASNVIAPTYIKQILTGLKGEIAYNNNEKP